MQFNEYNSSSAHGSKRYYIIPYRYLLIHFLMVLAAISVAFAVDPRPDETIEPNKWGLIVLEKLSEYDASVASDSSMLLVDLEKEIENIGMDIRYATANNFIKKPAYSMAKAFLRRPAAEALKGVQSELAAKGLGLKVFDAYRPYSVTLFFYETVRDTNFVAAPWHGSKHNRGCAVDVSIITLADGKEIEMPTPFDDFTEKAGPNYPDLAPKVLENRSLLISVMKKYGFEVNPFEWWHYDFTGWEKYLLMDIPFETLINR